MKLQSKAVMAALAGAAFLLACPAVQAAGKRSAKTPKAGYDLQSVPNVAAGAASSATNSAAQSAVRTARDDAARKARARQQQ